MNLRIGVIITVIALVGCTSTLPPEPLAAQAQVQPVKPVDPELAELMSLLGRNGPPSGDLASAVPANIRQHSFQVLGRDADPSLDAAGKKMVFASTAYSERSNLYLKSVEGQAVTQLTTDPASEIEPTLSPDGKQIAFACNRSGMWDIFVMGIDGKSIRQVTNGRGDNLHPSWSPDGTRLVYCCRSPQSGQWELWVIGLDSPESRQYIGQGVFPAWSPREDVIAFQRPRGRDKQLYGIWTVRLVNGEPSLPTLVASSPDMAYVSPTFSSDGKHIAFSGVPSDLAEGPTDIYSVEVGGGNLQQLTKGPGGKYNPTWVGDRVYFSLGRGGQENIWSVQVELPGTVTASTESGASKTVAGEE
jgi:TolB protein